VLISAVEDGGPCDADKQQVEGENNLYL